jgi:hypothetical protein
MPALHARPCRGQPRGPESDESNEQYRRELQAFLGTLTQEQRRLYAAVAANRLGRGGVGIVAEVTGLCKTTIARGRAQLADLLEGKPLKRGRKPVKGRPRIEEKYPAIKAMLEEMVSDEVAGDPDGEQKWVRSSVAKLTKRLRERGFPVSAMAVW